jgi:hypothetical protein
VALAQYFFLRDVVDPKNEPEMNSQMSPHVNEPGGSTKKEARGLQK